MENKIRIDQQIVHKVFRDCQNSYKITLRRFEMLKNIAKDQRPWNHQEVVNSWQTGINQYKQTL